MIYLVKQVFHFLYLIKVPLINFTIGIIIITILQKNKRRIIEIK